jgi:hypothetical protein
MALITFKTAVPHAQAGPARERSASYAKAAALSTADAVRCGDPASVASLHHISYEMKFPVGNEAFCPMFMLQCGD